MKRYMIWDSDAVDEEFVKNEREEMESVYPNQSDDWWWGFAEETNQEYLNCEKMNLRNIGFSKEIIIFAEVDLWYCRTLICSNTGTRKVSEILSSDGYLRGQSNIKYWVDAYGNLRAEESHHDGTNTYLFRVFKDFVSEETEEFVLDKATRGTLTKDDITRYTHRIGKEIADVYGWKVRKNKNED
nr:hypothetical protein [uncultured Lachnoclostridium sp.]